MTDLIVCARCRRHVRASSTECPFCARRPGALVTAVAIAVAATSLAACGGSEQPVQTPPDEGERAVPVYGAPAPEGPPPAATTPPEPSPAPTSTTNPSASPGAEAPPSSTSPPTMHPMYGMAPGPGSPRSPN